jgi:ATP-binding cassette subfamily B protein
MPAVQPSSPFMRLFQMSVRYRRTCVRATVYSVLNKAFDIAPEVLIGIAVDVVVKQQDSFLAKLGIGSVWDQLVVLAVVTFLIWAFESLFEYLFSIDWRNLAQTVQHDLRIEAYRHVQNLDVSYFEDKSAGSLVAVLNDDVNQLERFLDGGANALIQTATAVILIGGIFFYLAPSVAIWAMAPMPVIVVAAFWYQIKAEPLYAAVRGKAARLAGKLASNVSGVTTIKSQVAEEHELARVDAESRSYLESNRRAIAVSSAFIPLIRMAILAGFLATLLLGGRQAVSGELAVGSYGVLVFLTQRLLWPLTRLAETVDLYQRAKASTQRILALLETEIKAPPGTTPLPKEQVQGDIELVDLGFAYPGRAPLFEHLNLKIRAGTTIGLVGATGSGKSTFAKLILRFYEPTAGKILLDGHDLHTLKVGDLRRAIGFVSQDVFLFDGTVRENIAYGTFDATAAAVEHAAQVADAHEFIAKLPNGYDTLIGERGIRLSGGQRQRLAIARAVLKDPKVMVLDEATSAVDNESERLIQKALERIAVGRTMLVIAHRLSTIRNADRIYVVDEGKIVEQGTHEDLVKSNAQYSWLWKVQTGQATADA